MAEPDKIDKFVGNKLRERRKSLRLSQADLAALLDISYQQVQKYETGASKATIKRLLELSKILNVPTQYFYEGINIDEEIGVGLENDVVSTERTKPLNVLIVDDSPEDELLMRKAIDDSGEFCQIDSVNDPDKLMPYLRNLELHGKDRPDIVLMDLNMPKTDGISLLKQVKKDSQFTDIPVIIVTNSVDMDKLMDSYKLHAAGFVCKSLDYSKFIQSVKLVISYWAKAVSLPSM